MAMGALQSHKTIVNGGQGMGGGAVCMFVEDRTGEKMNPQNWARHWEDIWNALYAHVDKLDKQAFKPVSAVINKMLERSENDHGISRLTI